jgi:hypothetical protein
MRWRAGDLIPAEGLNFSHPSRPYCIMGTGTLSRGYSSRGMALITPSPSVDVKERVQLDLYFPYGLSCPVIRRNLPLPYVRLWTTISYLIVSRVFMIICMWLLYKYLTKFHENPCCGSRSVLPGVNKFLAVLPILLGRCQWNSYTRSPRNMVQQSWVSWKLIVEDPATGHLDTDFSWVPCVSKRMLRWFRRLQVATACF